VQADPACLEQVLVNLVVNARDAMPSGGRLEVRVGRATVARPGSTVGSDYATLEVSDSGVGMDEETRSQVFDPFFNTKTHGTGLGLASSYGAQTAGLANASFLQKPYSRADLLAKLVELDVG
jgi:two-component system, cell cycle sensor histidine kinase and response regulator CckA